jgi:hypothetical protein
MGPNSVPARVLFAVMTAGGFMVLLYDTLHQQPLHPLQFGLLVLIAVVASRFKVKLPGLNGNMSVNLPFILIAMVELSLLEALIVALCSTATQCLPKRGGKFKPIQILFNVSTMAVAVGLGGWISHHSLLTHATWSSASLGLVLAGASFFLAQTIPVAMIISLTEGGRALQIWCSIFQLSFPYYALSTGITSMATNAAPHASTQVPLLVLLVMFATYRSYRLYFGRGETTARPLAMAKAAGAAD